MDDIIALSDVAVEYDVPLHVDACLGGFVAAFMPEAGHPVPVFDFRLPGVASISADTHKVSVSGIVFIDVDVFNLILYLMNVGLF